MLWRCPIWSETQKGYSLSAPAPSRARTCWGGRRDQKTNKTQGDFQTTSSITYLEKLWFCCPKESFVVDQRSLSSSGFPQGVAYRLEEPGHLGAEFLGNRDLRVISMSAPGEARGAFEVVQEVVWIESKWEDLGQTLGSNSAWGQTEERVVRGKTATRAAPVLLHHGGH